MKRWRWRAENYPDRAAAATVRPAGREAARYNNLPAPHNEFLNDQKDLR
jgi:hypothetical protein